MNVTNDQLSQNSIGPNYSQSFELLNLDSKKIEEIWKKSGWDKEVQEKFFPKKLSEEENNKIENFCERAKSFYDLSMDILNTNNLKFYDIAEIKKIADEYFWRIQLLSSNKDFMFEAAKWDASKADTFDIKLYNGLTHSQIFEVTQIAADRGKSFTLDIIKQCDFAESELLTIAIMYAKHNAYECHEFGIKDPQNLFELAKRVISYSTIPFPDVIERFQINSEDRIFELAKFAVDRRWETITDNIQQSKIKDPLKLFEIAKIAASRCNINNIEKFQFQDQEQLLTIFKIALENSEKYQYSLVFGYIATIANLFLDKHHLLELAQLMAIKNLDNLSKSCLCFKSLDQDQKYILAKITAKSSYGSVCFDKYGIEDPDRRFEIAKISAFYDRHLSQYIEKYKIENQDHLYEIATIAAKWGPYLNGYISNYKIQDESKRYNIAIDSFMGDSPPTRLNELNIKEFALSLKFEINLFLQLLWANNFDQISDVIDMFEFFNNNLNEFKTGLSLMINPNVEIPPEDLALLGPMANCDRQILNEVARDNLRKWFGYLLLQLNFQMGNSKERFFRRLKTIDAHQMLSAIAKIHDPLKRYRLSGLFFNQLFEKDNEVIETYLKLKKTEEFQKKDNPIFRLLLACLIGSLGIDVTSPENWDKIYLEWKRAIQILTCSTYKDCTAQMTVIKTFYSVIDSAGFKSLKDGSRLILEIFKLADTVKDKKNKTKIVNFNLQLLEAILFAGNAASLDSFISLKPKSELLKMNSLQKCLKETFDNIIGKVRIDDFENKYKNTLLQSRKPNAFITYVSKVVKYDESFKPYIRNLYLGILNGNFQKERYEGNNHLSTVFSWREGFKEKWIKGSVKTISFDELNEKELAENEFDINKYLSDKIINDKHIPPENYPILVNFLKDPTHAKREESLKELNQQEEDLKNQALKENPQSIKTTKQIEFVKLQKALVSISNNRTDSAINAAKSYAPVEYPQFLQDLNDLIKLITQKKKILSNEKWTIEDTDAWEDLLLCGTEVLGSCQNIYGDPKYNKCLLNYILDGKNRIIIAKDGKGSIVARSIIRLLADSILKKPVIYREHIYTTAGIPNKIIDEINRMWIGKALLLKIPVVMSALDPTAKVNPYPNSLESLNGVAPFEYVDANRIGITNGKYSIPSSATDSLCLS